MHPAPTSSWVRVQVLIGLSTFSDQLHYHQALVLVLVLVLVQVHGPSQEIPHPQPK
jgi:hypothetical protein